MTKLFGRNATQLKEKQRWSKFLSSFSEMSKFGVLGLYKSFQVVEIIAYPPKEYSESPINLYSVLTCSDSECNKLNRKVEFLNKKRLKIKDLKDWSFGIVRYSRTIEEVKGSLSKFTESSIWDLAGAPISTGQLKPLNKQFVPASSFNEIAVNRTLKNNFDNGSYILELCDIGKEQLSPLTTITKHMQALSKEISEHIPINLASVSDRLGHVIFQFPITVLMASFECSQSDEISVNVSWKPGTVKRNLTASIEAVYDGILQVHHEIDLVDGSHLISSMDFSGGFTGRVWDKESNLLLYASSDLSFFKRMNMQMSHGDSEPRQFTIGEDLVNVYIAGSDVTSQFGEDDFVDLQRELVRKRLFRDEITSVYQRKEFVQYGKSNCKYEEHKRALEDLRVLIKQHGKGGVWLWDPYLSADDVLKTLFFCPHSNVELRALSGGKSPLNDDQIEDKNSDWSREQIDILDTKSGNKRGLNLEYRYRNGQYGWAFHDRFIIFPGETGNVAMAWSLGTSVNSMGYQHHTLQKVLDGELIKHSFEELWSHLEEERHLLWKT